MEGMEPFNYVLYADDDPQTYNMYLKTKPVITKRRLEREMCKYGINNITDSEDYHPLDMLMPVQSNDVVIYSKLEYNS